MLTLGRDRVELIANRHRKGRMESLSTWGEALTAAGVDQLVIHLRAVRRRIQAGKAGQAFALLAPVTHLPPQQVAATAVRVVVDSISACNTLHHVAAEVAEKLWIETMLDRASAQELRTFRRGRSRRKHQVAAISHMQRTEHWHPRERMASGVFLVELIAKEVGIVEITVDRSYKPPRRVVVPTDQCMAWVQDVKQQQKLMTPSYLPMLVPPRPWTSPLSGGYLTDSIPLVLMKSNAELVAQHTKGDEPYLQAANLHQAVAWQVNGWMLEQVLHAYDNSIEVGCLMPREGWPVPPYPKHLPEDSEGVRKWRMQARRIHEKNDKTKTARIAIAKCLWVAKRFVGEQRLHFPMSLDFRGRYYYRPPYLNPQGNDVSRCLLVFSDGQPITTEEQADWLRVHGANMYGHGGLDFRARIDWVHQEAERIGAAAADPWQHAEFWMRAKKPWSFLAFCRSYAEFMQQGYGYACQLPTMLDCTCSGIQHYSGLLLDEGMGKLTNLLPSDTPQDIYSAVIDRVLQVLRSNGDEDARKWLKLQPDRSLAKPVVMCLPYSATHSAFYFHCYDWAVERTQELFSGKSWATRKGAVQTVHYMARILHKEASALIGPAEQAMKWFRAIGKAAGKADIPLQWRTPSGLLVQQQYMADHVKRIRLKYLSDVRLDIKIKVDDEVELDGRRMANALSPNVLHSMDASHMALASIDAASKGVVNLAGVHDCFVTTPAEMTQLRNSVRAAFAALYSERWFDRISDQLLTHTQVELSRPQAGQLDPSLVKSSDYFIT